MSPGKISKEEQLMWERKRCVSWGITEFESHLDSGKFAFPAAGSLFGCADRGTGAASYPYEIKSACQAARIHPKMCPANPDLLVFVSNADLWLTNSSTGQELRLTFACRGSDSRIDDPLMAGMPSYVMQEEFNRFTGFWWRPIEEGKICKYPKI